GPGLKLFEMVMFDDMRPMADLGSREGVQHSKHEDERRHDVERFGCGPRLEHINDATVGRIGVGGQRAGKVRRRRGASSPKRWRKEEQETKGDSSQHGG